MSQSPAQEFAFPEGFLWGAATAFGLAFAAWTAVGPVLVILTRGHGVHAGDLVAFAAAYSTAAVLTRRLLTRA